MKNVIGVHFWDKKVFLCWCEEESISTASFNLPADLRRDDILEQEPLLTGVLKAIRQYLKEKLNIYVFGLAIAVPDQFGIEEIRRIYNVARQCDIEVVQVVDETLAFALHLYGEYDFDGRMLSAVIADGRLSISEYDFSDKGVEKICTYIAGRWTGASITRAPFLHSYSNGLFDATEAGIIFGAGSMNACISMEQSLKSYIKEGTFVNTSLEFKMKSSDDIIEGLGYICGKLEGRDAFAGLGVSDNISPYELYVGINEDIYSAVKPETSLSKNAGLEIKKLPESTGASESFTVYEKKQDRLVKIGSLKLPKDNLSDYYKKAVWVGLGADEHRALTLLIQQMDSEKYIELPIGAGDGSGDDGDKEENVADFVEKILPIIDNLEYASKFAQDPDNPYTKGIIQSYENAVKILEENGVTLITGEGEPFDYNLQNAVAHIADVDLPENTVKQVMQTGYIYKGKVIRTASVIVAN
ncbi:GrpE protein [Lachnospiraceae bacterium NE2001]|nr:GrpE protein [Lachnospiraceae bacterium NE2001]